jgi:hypothetical protein
MAMVFPRVLGKGNEEPRLRGEREGGERRLNGPADLIKDDQMHLSGARGFFGRTDASAGLRGSLQDGYGSRLGDSELTPANGIKVLAWHAESSAHHQRASREDCSDASLEEFPGLTVRRSEGDQGLDGQDHCEAIAAGYTVA